jgi:hypothetical protein
MPRAGVSRERAFETAEVLVREGRSSGLVAVRTRLGGCSPTAFRWYQGWSRPFRGSSGGIAWREAQGELAGGRAALGQLREETEQERTEMRAERGRLDAQLETGLSRGLTEHDRVVVAKGQVRALFLGASLGHTGALGPLAAPVRRSHPAPWLTENPPPRGALWVLNCQCARIVRRPLHISDGGRQDSDRGDAPESRHRTHPLTVPASETEGDHQGCHHESLAPFADVGPLRREDESLAHDL